MEYFHIIIWLLTNITTDEVVNVFLKCTAFSDHIKNNMHNIIFYQ